MIAIQDQGFLNRIAALGRDRPAAAVSTKCAGHYPKSRLACS